MPEVEKTTNSKKNQRKKKSPSKTIFEAHVPLCVVLDSSEKWSVFPGPGPARRIPSILCLQSIFMNP